MWCVCEVCVCVYSMWCVCVLYVCGIMCVNMWDHVLRPEVASGVSSVLPTLPIEAALLTHRPANCSTRSVFSVSSREDRSPATATMGSHVIQGSEFRPSCSHSEHSYQRGPFSSSYSNSFLLVWDMEKRARPSCPSLNPRLIISTHQKQQLQQPSRASGICLAPFPNSWSEIDFLLFLNKTFWYPQWQYGNQGRRKCTGSQRCGSAQGRACGPEHTSWGCILPLHFSPIY